MLHRNRNRPSNCSSKTMLALYCNISKLSGESQQRTYCEKPDFSLREYISQSESKICKACKWPISCGTKFLREFIFARLTIFCVFRELIFAISTDWFLLQEINFCDFQKVPSTGQHWKYFRYYIIEYTQQKYIFSSNKPVFCCFWMKETSCDWTDAIS